MFGDRAGGRTVILPGLFCEAEEAKEDECIDNNDPSILLDASLEGRVFAPEHRWSLINSREVEMSVLPADPGSHVIGVLIDDVGCQGHSTHDVATTEEHKTDIATRGKVGAARK